MRPEIWLLLSFLASALPAQANDAEADARFFEQRIRPLLIEQCQDCHGPEKQRGGLRTDSLAGLLKGGDLGPALTPSKPDASRMIEAVSYANDDLQMPPKNRLSEAQVADLRRWIERGAVWPGAAAAPAAEEDGEMVFTDEMKNHWAFQPVRPDPDKHTIDDFFDDRDLAPAPPAVLLRRLTFDLTGLPPAPAEIAAFEADCAEDRDAAVKAAIQRLLDSPHHGERWGRHWLDVARYADSNGSEVDHAMANAWRYRDWVVRALNEDLPFDRFLTEQLAGDLIDGGDPAATGLLMLGPKALAELDKRKLLADTIDEQVDSVTRAFIALTVGCARCHDHKFDPIPTADYYALAGIFSSVETLDTRERVAKWLERPATPEAEALTDSLSRELDDLRAQRERIADGGGKRNLALAAGEAYLLVEAEDFRQGNVWVDDSGLGKGIGVIRTREMYPDHIEYEFELPKAGEYQLELRYAAKESRPIELSINGNLEEMEAAAEVTGNWNARAQRWFVQGRYEFVAGKNRLVFHRDGPVPLFDKWIVGRPSDKPHFESAKSSRPDKPAKPAALKALDERIAALEEELTRPAQVMAPREGEIRDAPILIRGNPGTPGEIVPRGFLRIAETGAAAPGEGQSGRLELARWLTHPDHPLTARVIVNRVWHWHFGEGLVATPDNFGLRGAAPANRQLLDWLAAWFVENGWSLKKLHRLICASDFYQRADFPMRRLSAEELRDAMLMISGRLDRSIGGSLMTVKNRTYANGGNAPKNVTNNLGYDSTRRTIYLPVIRTALHDFAATFDYPDPGMLIGRRNETTVVQQALFLMNSPFVGEQAEALARQLLARPGDDRDRLRAAWQLVYGREPDGAELESALEFLAESWPKLCHMLLSSNDFLYVR